VAGASKSNHARPFTQSCPACSLFNQAIGEGIRQPLVAGSFTLEQDAKTFSRALLQQTRIDYRPAGVGAE
jgi:hypothetical protein